MQVIDDQYRWYSVLYSVRKVYEVLVSYVYEYE